MKGFSHFITGVAAASFFPWSVQAAAEGNPLYFILGGAFGILPDTMDFKFYRFFYKHDIYIIPDPHKPDPQAIAEELARAVGMAQERDKEVRVKLNTIRMGADYWQQYIVKFDAERQEVSVRFGPVVNTGQVPVPNSEPDNAPVGVAKFPCNLVQTYESVTTVDIFDGPTFAFKRDGEGRSILHFLPWHRTWSHSLLTGAFFGLLCWPIWGWKAALVVPAGFSVHVLEDQLGYMGSNLFWPITKGRFQGLKRMHATDTLPNFIAVWTCIMLIFWNLYRFQPAPVYHFNFLQLILYGTVIPMGAFGLLHRFLSRNKEEEDRVIDVEREEADLLTG
ncbi:MAG: metal-dependent hydrolase [Verrucomicrobia bacterium]|nr:metal-dependent hydrolase [Verrucomicrobiota bacterium]